MALQLSLNSGMKALVARSISGNEQIKAELENQFSWEKILFSLFLLAALTGSHENSSRYPPTEKGNIVCQDYTDKMSIVKNIKWLCQILDDVLPKIDNLLQGKL